MNQYVYDAQYAILEQVKDLGLSKLPHTIAVSGDEDGGQLEVVEYMAQWFNLPLVDITDKLSLETIDEIYASPTHSFYYIRMADITEKEQNVILKFLEEPPEYSWLFLIIGYMGRGRILNTILNRCMQWHLNSYPKSVIESMTDDPIIIQFARTPVQVEKYQKLPLTEMYNLADNMIENIDRAYFSNCLVISSKMAFTKESNGYDVKLFLRMALSLCVEKFIFKDNMKYLNAHNIINEVLSDIIEYPLINKEWIFNDMLLRLKQVMSV